jgi:uncharacterized protein (TIGR00288 family)
MIDFDNVTMGIRSDLQDQLRRLLNSEIIKGKVAVQRAYADWRRYPQYIVPLSEASIDLIFAPAFGSNKKNATDIRLAIDALELVFTRPEIGTFILLSGDSDFSSLVLKLKEYGKYIIGVGIRESSSDLLIQNCDEYYSYTEVTGLTREGELESTRRDPWELVVDAVMQMTRDGDVMRSDRLKQVMQTLDANFSEKDVGFSRFSKFVVEAAQRGLLRLQKMENGQYAIDVGENANIPPGEEATLQPKEPAAKPRRKRTPRRREEPEAPRQLTLSEAFELLRQAALILGAVGGDTSTAEAVRAKMVELIGDDGDPVFSGSRFQRLLRQAHDANIVELAKEADGDYILSLGERALVEETTEVAAPEPQVAAESHPEPESPATEKPKRTRRTPARKSAKTTKSTQTATTSKTTRSTRSKGRGTRSKGDAEGAKEAEVAKSEKPKPTAKPESGMQGTASGKSTPSKRNPRYRRGSRGAPPPSRKPSESTEAKTADDTQSGAMTPKPRSRGARGIGMRTGGRSKRRTSGASSDSGSSSDGSSAHVPSETKSATTPTRDIVKDAPLNSTLPESFESTSTRPVDPPRDTELPEVGESNILKRMSAAFQRVMKGPEQ